MWTAVIVLGLGLAVDPLRLGLVAVVLARQRPMRIWSAFWLGGMVASIGLGVAVLVVFRGVALTAIEHMVSALDSLRSLDRDSRRRGASDHPRGADPPAFGGPLDPSAIGDDSSGR